MWNYGGSSFYWHTCYPCDILLGFAELMLLDIRVLTVVPLLWKCEEREEREEKETERKRERERKRQREYLGIQLLYVRIM